MTQRRDTVRDADDAAMRELDGMLNAARRVAEDVRVPPLTPPRIDKKRGHGWLIALGMGSAIAVALLVALLMRREPEVTSPIAEAPPREEHVIAKERRTLRYDDAVVTLSPGADAIIARRPLVVELRSGVLDAEVTHRDEVPRMVVRTAFGAVEVVGTVFRVEVREDHANVAVSRGRVKLSGARGEDLGFLDGGENRELLGPEGRTLPEPAPRASPPPGPQPARNPPERTPTPESPEWFDTVVAAVDAANCAEAERRSEDKTGRPNGARIAEALVAIGRCYDSKGEGTRAVLMYRAAVRGYPDTPAAANAAYELARALVRTGDTDKAIAAFEAFARTYPKAELAEDARFRACSLEFDRENDARALTCVRGYRKAHPRGTRLHETYYIEGAALRRAHDCVNAIIAYDRYLQTAGPLADDARRGRAWCENEVKQ